MNKKTAWLLSLGVAAMITANGLVMAATTPDENTAANGKRPQTAHKGEFGKKGEKKVFQRDNKALLEFLKIDEKTFETAMKDGKTLADIAKEQGISEQKLKDFLVEQMTKRFDADTKAGKLSEDKKAQFRADIEKRVSDMISGKAPMRGHGPMGHSPFNNAKLLDLLKMDEESLKADMKAGKTLATIAKEHGVSEQALKDLLVQEMSQRIEKGVAAGRISADKAGEMKSNMEKRVSDMINGNGPMKGHRPMGHSPFNNAKLLDLLKMDEESLKADMKAGKTLATIAKEHGVSEQALKDLLVQEMSQRIDAGVAAGKISEDKAGEMKSNMEKRVSDMINSNGPMHNRQHKAVK